MNLEKLKNAEQELNYNSSFNLVYLFYLIISGCFLALVIRLTTWDSLFVLGIFSALYLLFEILINQKPLSDKALIEIRENIWSDTGNQFLLKALKKNKLTIADYRKLKKINQKNMI